MRDRLDFIRKEVKVKCLKCNGAGEVISTSQVVAKLGMVDILTECPTCNGAGHSIRVIRVKNKTIKLEINTNL